MCLGMGGGSGGGIGSSSFNSGNSLLLLQVFNLIRWPIYFSPNYLWKENVTTFIRTLEAPLVWLSYSFTISKFKKVSVYLYKCKTQIIKLSASGQSFFLNHQYLAFIYQFYRDKSFIIFRILRKCIFILHCDYLVIMMANINDEIFHIHTWDSVRGKL